MAPVTSRLRVLAATALVAIGLVVGVPAAAGAAPAGTSACKPITVQVATRGAEAVFVGKVTDSSRAARTDGLPGEIFTQPVTVSRVYQGNVASDQVVVQSDRQPQQCTVGRLLVGSTYVFFVQGDGDPWVAAGGGGTATSTARLVGQVERLLGDGRQPVAPRPETATFTPVNLDDPLRLSRVAAPGAALVIIGLLGLLVVGRVSKR